MKHEKKTAKQDSLANVALVSAMYMGAILITCSGALFLVYSFARSLQISISSLSIPGFVIALLMIFFGIRSFFAVGKLSRTILNNPLRLSLIFKKSCPLKSKSI